jgi:putative pantetheine hydrolase
VAVAEPAGPGGPGRDPDGTAPGPGNSLTDVAGLRVGHETLDGDGWLTGVTVVLAPPGGAVGGVDVRGGGPGTRETDLLDPRNMVERVHAVVLAGGSAYGLAAAHGVLTRLAAAGRGLPMGTDPSHVVPIVPAAILFDLGRGGVFGHYPGERAGEAAFDAALGPAGADPVACGNVGAGTGAVAGQLKGGLGSASAVVALPAQDQSTQDHPVRTVTVAALAVVNAVGSVADPRTGLLYGASCGLPGEFSRLGPPAPAELAAAADRLAPRTRGGPPAGASRPPLPPPLNTTIGVVACDASLTKAQCAKLAAVAHDGLARAVRPAHSMFDGDTIFALATGEGPAASPAEFHALLTEAADCFARAVTRGVLAAGSVQTAGGAWPGYLGLFPSAGRR